MFSIKATASISAAMLAFATLPALPQIANAQPEDKPSIQTLLPSSSGLPDTVKIDDVTPELLEQYGAEPDVAYSDDAQQIADAIDANPVLEAQVENSDTIKVFHPFENRSLVVEASAKLPDTASSICYEPLLDSYIVDFPDEESCAAAFETITQENGTGAAFPDVTVKPCSVNYALYDGWGMSSMNLSTTEYKLDAAKLPTKNSVTVAVIDTGVFSSHEIFTDTIISSKSGSVINARKAALTSRSFTDDDGHGTHVSGIIAQGTPSLVNLLEIKCYNAPDDGARLSDLCYGVLYAQEKGARVFNISLGAELGLGDSTDDTIAGCDKMLKKVRDNGGLVFAAAGNNSADANTIAMYPAVSQYVYTVSALDRDSTIASYSNYGSSIDFTAPGSSIVSSWNTGKQAKNLISGTSMACPHVSAFAADLMVMYPNLTSEQIIEKMKSMCVDLGPKGKDTKYGYGKPVMSISAVDQAIQDTSVLPIANGSIKPSALLYSGVSKTYRYTGSNICPKPVLKAKVNGQKITLTRFKDYMLTYTGNKKPGTAKISITLMGKYTGKYSISYKIVR